MSSDVAISVRDLNKIYGVGSKNEKVALNSISLQVKKGSIFGLLFKRSKKINGYSSSRIKY